MSYRKLKAEYLFDGFTMRKTAVLLVGEDGIIESILDEKDAGGDLEIYDGLLCPGFINAHCHLELSHLNGLIPEQLGLVNFVFSVISQRNHAEEVKKEAIRQAESDMWFNGIAAVGDICNTGDTLDQKIRGNEATPGLGKPVFYYERPVYFNFIEVFGWAPDLAESRYDTSLKLAARFEEAGIPARQISLSPHAPYSVSEALWNKIRPGFTGKTITMHNQETAAENEYFQSGTGDLRRMYQLIKTDTAHFHPPGCSSLTHVLPKLLSAAKVLLVHNTFTGEADIQSAMKLLGKRLFFCFCPNANLYIENRLPDIPLFMRLGAQMVLGTDSLASNHQLSILEEIKSIKKHYPSIPSAELLLWATSNGAKFLSFEDKLGDFSKGKKPGVLLIGGVQDGEVGAGSHCRRII